MTGTADTEAFEFRQIYGLDCVVIPTNVPMLRDDLNDLVYLTREEKFEAIIEDVRACIESGAPVLVGTASVETSEELSQAFRKKDRTQSAERQVSRAGGRDYRPGGSPGRGDDCHQYGGPGYRYRARRQSGGGAWRLPGDIADEAREQDTG
jgi:hypothetical protein